MVPANEEDDTVTNRGRGAWALCIVLALTSVVMASCLEGQRPGMTKGAASDTSAVKGITTSAQEQPTPPAQGYQILAIEGRLYGADTSEESSNVIDNPRVKLWNVLQRRLRISITVASAPDERQGGRVTLLAWEEGREVFARTDSILPQAGGRVRVVDFWLEGNFGCHWLILRAYVGRLGPPDAVAWRVIPFECGE